MATAKLVPPVPTQQDVELRLSHREADVLANILGLVATNGEHGPDVRQVANALGSVGFQSNAYATWKSGGIVLK